MSDAGDADSVAISPSWWAPALAELASGTGEVVHELMLLAPKLEELRASAAAEEGADSLRARVLDVLAKAASPLLRADNWAEPYEPAMRVEDRRSVVPSDLSEPDLRLLAELAALIEQPALRARVADIAWHYGDRRDMGLLETAVDSYRAHPLDSGTFVLDGRDSWRRALELALRRGAPGRPAVDAIAHDLTEFLVTSDASAGFALIMVSELLGLTRSVDQGQARVVADRCAAIAGIVDAENHRLRRGCERAARDWYARGKESALAHGCLQRVADS